MAPKPKALPYTLSVKGPFEMGVEVIHAAVCDAVQHSIAGFTASRGALKNGDTVWRIMSPPYIKVPKHSLKRAFSVTYRGGYLHFSYATHNLWDRAQTRFQRALVCVLDDSALMSRINADVGRFASLGRVVRGHAWDEEA